MTNYYENTPTGNIDRSKNTQHTMAMRLYSRILSDLDSSNFTLEDIREGFNAMTPVSSSKNEIYQAVRFGQSHLDYLEARGLIIKNEDNSYSVNHGTNPAQIAEGLKILKQDDQDYFEAEDDE